jgi:hypothetical protein
MVSFLAAKLKGRWSHWNVDELHTRPDGVAGEGGDKNLRKWEALEVLVWSKKRKHKAWMKSRVESLS